MINRYCYQIWSRDTVSRLTKLCLIVVASTFNPDYTTFNIMWVAKILFTETLYRWYGYMLFTWNPTSTLSKKNLAWQRRGARILSKSYQANLSRSGMCHSHWITMSLANFLEAEIIMIDPSVYQPSITIVKAKINFMYREVTVPGAHEFRLSGYTSWIQAQWKLDMGNSMRSHGILWLFELGIGTMILRVP